MTAPLFAPPSAPTSSPCSGGLAEAELTTICAWCGAHLSGPRLVLVPGVDREVSHGICGDCAALMALPCDDCGASTAWDRLTETIGGGAMVCEGCAERRGRDPVDGRASD